MCLAGNARTPCGFSASLKPPDDAQPPQAGKPVFRGTVGIAPVDGLAYIHNAAGAAQRQTKDGS